MRSRKRKKNEEKRIGYSCKEYEERKKKRKLGDTGGGGGWGGKARAVRSIKPCAGAQKKKGTERNDEKRKKRKRYIQTFWFVVRADTAPAEVGGKGTSTTAGRKAEEQGTSSRPPLTNRFANPANATGPAVPGRN